ncbi:MAG TPA: adenylate/guanylate cyclase domain-containing protein [Leptospiraceae bacterium]|nr:adenylate/guanylate cyclase domain-containing protein [Leptospiraceae bacterium]HNI96378.1 adenylate/guanylate cyclase domain-containing protein [Leptospiraceae bacterium]HNN04259.1 adenylate/guanylate cyclase domain-containing protein [Leptospiraceae bacterium]
MKIRYKLILLIILTVLAVAVPISYVVITRSETIIVKNTYFICSNLSESISNIAREELFLNTNYEGTEKVLQGLNASNFQGLYNVYIINIDGKYVADLRNREIGKYLSDEELKYIQSIQNLSYRQIKNGNTSVLRFTYPIFLDHTDAKLKIGATVFDFEYDLLFAPVSEMRAQILLFSASILLFSILTGVLFSYLLTKPVQLLSKGAKVIRAGSLDYRIPLKGSDEIGQLAEEFNSMTAEIQRAQKDLKSLNENLEQKVKERTSELIKANEEAEIEKKNALQAQSEAEAERTKSEKLLLNILPSEIVKELKEKGHTVPVFYETVTVMFTDFKGFTKISETMAPQELVKELDGCFIQFDMIMDRFRLEKLKTIGDSYMAAGGIPNANRTNPIDAVLAAMEILAFMDQMKIVKEAMGLPYWELRMGINTGSLVAGVIGEKKFAYDVWGDTVNTASRLESSGTPGKINISEATYLKIRDFFNCEYRGRIEAKNKGEISMYYVTGIKKELSVNGEGKTPNTAFMEKMNKI